MDRLCSHRSQCVILKFKRHAVKRKLILVLFDKRVFRFGKNLDECVFVKSVESDDNRHTSDKFGDKTEFDKVGRLQRFDKFVVAIINRSFHRRAEAELRIVFSLVDNLVQINERTAAKEQNVGCIELIAFLIGVLSAALRRHVCNRSFDDFEQCLLHALTADVARDGHVFALLCYFVDFVDIHDADFRSLQITVCGLNELQKNVFDVLADVTCLGKRGCIGNRKRHVEDLRKRFRKQSFTGTRRSKQKHVALFDDHVVVGFRADLIDTLIMIVHGNRQHAFCAVLTDDVFVEFLFDFLGRIKAQTVVCSFFVLAEKVGALIDTFVADIYAVGAADDFFNLAFASSAKTAMLFFMIIFHT